MHISFPPWSGLSQAITVATLLFSSLVYSLPTADVPEHYANDTLVGETPKLQKRVPDFYLRILPLGASIVWGVGSTHNNGFRKYLRDTLRQSGYKVNMVGNRNNGDMLDNAVEATSGFHVHQVHAAALTATKYKPNVVLINAGTNDAREHDNIGQVGERMDALIDDLQAQIPGVTILLSTILASTNEDIMKNWRSVNAQYQHIVMHRRYVRNQKVILVDFEKPGFSWGIPTSLLVDGIHPNNEGFELMASAWFQGIMEAYEAGFLSPPADSSFVDDDSGQVSNTCDKVYGVSRGPISTQAGSGLDDGTYTHSSSSKGLRATLYSESDTNPFVFARLSSGTDRHYIVEVTSKTDPQNGGRYHTFYRPTTPGSWDMQGVEFWMPDGCIKRGIRWADTNANGHDDMLCISANGDTYVTHNLALDTIMPAPVPVVFSGLWKSNEGYPQDRVRIADIDGDGRADYCVVQDNGDIKCWRNGGQGDMPEYWQPLGIVFTGKGMGDVNGVRFYDINGDGRDDWLWMDGTGKTHTWVNNRGCDKGAEGQGLTPNWRAATSNPTHQGLNIANVRDQLYFANVYDSPAAFGMLPRGDYVRIQPKGAIDIEGYYQYDFSVWQNTGGGGSKLKGDGTRHCNMMGHANGAQDLVWVHSTGYMRIYESRGGSFPPEPPYWGSNYIIWDLSSTRPMDRRDLHLADWNGDGLCDIIWVSSETSVVDVWINKYKQNNNFNTWEYRHDVGPKNTLNCPPRGKGLFDLGVQFADLDGNGMADMICLEKNGRASGWLNTNGGNTLTFHPQFKFSEGKDRANLRFGDVNGDGRADLLWIDKFNGDTTVWYNKGQIPASGSSFTWENKGKLFQGAMQGSCTMYPDLDGNSRVDMTAVDAMTNEATTWFNDCGDRGGDDPNTHTTRAQIPAPEVELNKALILAARWSARRNDIQYHADPFDAQPFEFTNTDEYADRLNFHSSCNDPGLKLKVYSGWLQYWELVKHNIKKLNYGEYSFGDQIAVDYWGAPDKFQQMYRNRVMDVLRYMGEYSPDQNTRTVQRTLDVACNLNCGGTTAYAQNAGQGHPAFPSSGSMTYCPPYFDSETDLVKAMVQDNINVPIDKYKNKGTVWFHEMLHLWEVSKPGNGFGDVTDVVMKFDFYRPDGTVYEGEQKAYGGDFAKALALHATNTGTVYTHRNSDSYMLSTLGSYAREYSNLRQYPAHPLAGLPPKRIEPFKARVRKSRRQDPALGGSNSTLFSWSSANATNSTSYAALIIENALTLYPNGTAKIDSDARPTYYADHESDIAPIKITFQSLVGGNSSAASNAYLEENWAAIMANQNSEPATVSTVVPEAPAVTSPAVSPAESGGVLPSGLAAMAVNEDLSVQMSEWHCNVGVTPVDCVAG